jgi:hypothetical protein
MLALGKLVTLRGEAGLVVARTFGAEMRYDVRLDKGEILKYVKEEEIEQVGGWGIDPKRVIGSLVEDVAAAGTAR